MTAFTIEAGRGRITLNSHTDKAHLAIDVNGAGYSLFLERRQMLELAGALIQGAFTLEDKR